jgi:hypothetical protein
MPWNKHHNLCTRTVSFVFCSQLITHFISKFLLWMWICLLCIPTVGRLHGQHWMLVCSHKQKCLYCFIGDSYDIAKSACQSKSKQARIMLSVDKILWSKSRRRVISGFRRDVDEICTLFRYYEANSGNSIAVFWENISVPSSKGQEFSSWPLKMGPICCPETPVRSYDSTLRNIGEQRRSKVTKI